MSTRNCKSKRMNAMQLLSFQSNLYAQTDIRPQRALQICPISLVPRDASQSVFNEREAILSVVKGLRGDESGTLHSNSPNRSKSMKRCLTRGKSFIRKGKAGEEHPRRCRTSNDAKTPRLSDDSLNVSGWTVTPLSQENRSMDRCQSTKTKNVSARGEDGKLDFLAPLRYSTKYGRSAWRFVLPSPDPKKQSTPCTDLPEWYRETNEEIRVKLGPRGISPTESAATSISTSDCSSSDESRDFISISSKLSSEDMQDTCLPQPIYAEPSFSSSAPLPCQLPIPTFLARR